MTHYPPVVGLFLKKGILVLLRDFLDSVLAFIGCASLTDDEFNALPEGLDADYTLATYNALKTVLQEREGVSGKLTRLQGLFVAKGVSLSGLARDPASQIFVGEPI